MRRSNNEAQSVPVIHSVQSIGITAHQTQGSQPGLLPIFHKFGYWSVSVCSCHPCALQLASSYPGLWVRGPQPSPRLPQRWTSQPAPGMGWPMKSPGRIQKWKPTSHPGSIQPVPPAISSYPVFIRFSFSAEGKSPPEWSTGQDNLKYFESYSGF